MQIRKYPIFLSGILLSTNCNYSVNSLSVAVFGGSGFLGRRICRELVLSGHEVTSISRNGKPPSYYTSSDDTERWANDVNWLAYTIHDEDDTVLELPAIEAGISCIGNVNPDPDFDKLSFFGLTYDDETLFRENGLVNECAARLAKNCGAERFVFMSVSYEVAKMVEGPIDGYTRGKRYAEHSICKLFGEDNCVVLGPSLIYGGNRFPVLGKKYSEITRSGIVNAYANGMDALRNLSSSPIEDWVERSLLSPPVEVTVVARVACAAALGAVTKEMVGPRRQNFFNEQGKPVIYDDVVYIDGTKELERIDELIIISTRKEVKGGSGKMPLVIEPSSEGKEPLWEGALVYKTPYLYPVPIIAFFSALFHAIATGQFINN